MEAEQIIKINTDEESNNSQVKKQKDPKKVAAGKALAKKNSEARKLIKESKSEESKIEESKSEEVTSLTFFDVNNNLHKAAGVVTAGFALYHGWKFFSSKQAERAKQAEQVEQEEQAEQVEPPKEKKRKSIDF